MAFCTNCGARLEDGASFCTECGTRVGHTQEQTPRSQYENTYTGAQTAYSTVPEHKKGNTVLIVILAVLGIAIIALAAAVLAGLKNSPAEDRSGTAGSSAAAPVQADYSWWAGDWYGWWIVYDADGSWEDLAGSYWDACARIEVDGDNGTVVIWDEDCAEDEYICKAQVRFEEGLTEAGAMCSVSGSFFGDDIPADEWYVDPGDGTVVNISSMFAVYGSFEDEDNGCVEYMVFLRPWGTEWEDVRTGDMSEEIYDDMMPGLYDDWYLPLIRAGVEEAPAVIGNESDY